MLWEAYFYSNFSQYYNNIKYLTIDEAVYWQIWLYKRMAWQNKTFGHLYSPYPHEKFKTKCQRFFLVVGHHQHFFSKLDRVQIITNASIFLEMTTKNSIILKLRSSHMYLPTYLPSASASLWCQWDMHRYSYYNFPIYA